MEWKMPDLGEGVLEGEVVKWLVKEGDTASEGQPLVEVMTDKATMELPTHHGGKISKIVAKEGQVVKVGQILAVIGEEEEPAKTEISRSERPATGDAQSPAEGSLQGDGRGWSGRTRSRTPETKISGPLSGTSQKPQASPAVRALARQLNVDLATVMGTGPGGRIEKIDVQKTAREGMQVPPPPTAAPEIKKPPLILRGTETRIPLRGLRRKIAEHMMMSRKSTAHFTHCDVVDLTDLVALRQKEKTKAEKAGVKLTYLAYFVRAVTKALLKHPSLNSSLDDDAQEIVQKDYCNIGIAVDTDAGLIVPVIKDTQKLGLYEIAKEIVRLSTAARDGKITLEDLKGGTFTITNVGSIGGILSAPVINYPEVAIMGLHEMKPTPVVKNGQIVVREMMNISLSADHRVVDGANAARFCKEVIQILEKPNENL